MHAISRALCALGVLALCLGAIPGAQGATLPPPAAPSAAPSPTSPPVPIVPASAWLVADLDTGEILASHDPHAQYAPASTLKVLTAVTVLDEVPLDEAVLVSYEAAHTEGSSVGLYENQTYPMQELLEGMMTVSGNDAANALGQSRPDMLEKMNDKARSLGAKDTVAMSFSGLDAAGQVTSAHDLAVLLRAALKDPFYAEMNKKTQVDFTRHDGKVVPLYPHGKFVGVYPGAIGGKNGYTISARSSFVGAAERDGVRLVAVVLRSERGVGAQVGSLLDWGFAVHDTVTPVGRLASPVGDPPSEDLVEARAALQADRYSAPSPLAVAPEEPTLVGDSALPGRLLVAAAAVALILLGVLLVLRRVRSRPRP